MTDFEKRLLDALMRAMLAAFPDVTAEVLQGYILAWLSQDYAAENPPQPPP
jgi:hypothetical protein